MEALGLRPFKETLAVRRGALLSSMAQAVTSARQPSAPRAVVAATMPGTSNSETTGVPLKGLQGLVEGRLRVGLYTTHISSTSGW